MVGVIIYQEEDGTCPVIEFLAEEPIAVQQKAYQRIEELKALGHTARRPLVENLGSGLYELRWHVHRVQYRILYFFHGRQAVVLAHALTKEANISPADLDRARCRKVRFERNPTKHTRPGEPL